MAEEKLGIGQDRGPDQDPNPNVPSRPVQGQDHKSQAKPSLEQSVMSRHVMSEYNGSFLSTMMMVFPPKRSSTVVVIVYREHDPTVRYLFILSLLLMHRISHYHSR